MFTKHWVPAHSQQLLIAGDRKDIFGTSTSKLRYEGFGDDPDRLNTNDILSKLSQCQDRSYLPLVHTGCECYKVAVGDNGKKETLSDILKEDSESSSSSEEEDLSFEYMIEKLDFQRRKADVTVQQKTLITLIRSYKSQETLTPESVHKLIAYLHTENIVMREAGLILLQQCCNHGNNVQLLIELGVLNDLTLIITSRDCKPVHAIALDAIRKIIEHASLKEIWWEPIQTLLPKLLTKLTNEKRVDVKVAVLKILKILSNVEEGASWVTGQGMPVLASMKDKNTDIKECFAEILTGLVCHGNPATVGNLDNKGVYVGLDLLQAGPCGPQVRSLKLICNLINTSAGLTDVVNANVVPYVLSALRDSRCRKVKATAAGVLGSILSTRKPGQVKDILKQAWEFFEILSKDPNREEHAGIVHHVGDQQIVYPLKLKSEPQVKLDVGLEKLVKVTVDLLCQEGCIEKGPLGQHLSVHLSPGVDKGLTKLSALRNAVNVLQVVCCLPWTKPYISSGSQYPGSDVAADTSSLADSESRRLMLSRVNPQQTQLVWDVCGTSLVDFLRIYTRRFKTRMEKYLQKAKSFVMAVPKIMLQKRTASASSIKAMFEENEQLFIMSLMELMLTFAYCSCESFENLGDKKYQTYISQSSVQSEVESVKNPTRPQSAKPTPLMKKSHQSKRNRPTSARVTYGCGSNQPIVIPVAGEEDMADQSAGVSCTEKARSNSPRGKNSKWRSSTVVEQSANTLHSRIGNNCNILDKHHIDLMKKVNDSQRRLMRRCLFEAGVFEAVSPLILCSDVNYKVLCIQILRCLIQPLGEKVVSISPGDFEKPKHSDRHSPPSCLKQRPQSACPGVDREKRLRTAMQSMSPSVATVIAKALDADGHNMPLQLVARHNTPVRVNNPSTNLPAQGDPTQTEICNKPKVDVTRPIAHQCRLCLLDSVGSDLLTGLFSQSRAVKRHTLLLLEDLVHHGDVSLHMTLSERGCIPKLVDFLRVNEDDDLMEITALIVTRMLVASDVRLRKVFDVHGGSNLLMAMARYTKGLLREEVALTLKTVNKAANRGRPQSAPPGSPVDIWEQINKRWKQEDKVSEILQQWNK
ncbi:uncharacterized protein LOC135482020 isoform X2 [Liolophura sinensis]|uniref:uncharacterized protein LOC135482020 isoform X2 n=1 Tax=Liolophura sinensis TaxID=3198878 RepID=UPI0031586DFC